MGAQSPEPRPCVEMFDILIELDFIEVLVFGEGGKLENLEKNPWSKDGKIRDTKTLNLLCNIVSFQVFGRCFSFFTLQGQLVAQQKHLLQLKKVVAQSRARVNFEQQISALVLVFHQTLNL